MQVLKFGGSSVGTPEAISKVIAIVKERVKTKQAIVVVSAMSGVTDQLILLAQSASQGNEAYKTIIQNLEQKHLDAVRALLPIQQQSGTLSMVKQLINEIESNCDGLFMLRELTMRMQDRLISYGEILSSKIIAAAFEAEGVDQVWLDSRAMIKTNSKYFNAVVDKDLTNKTIQAYFSTPSNKHALYMAPGFIASDAEGNTTTLGRGGSDYTGAIYAAALNAAVLEIWTDVSGMMTADPRMVQNAKEIPKISYQEAMELSHFGAKIIYPPTIQPVMYQNIPVRIKNTFEPEHPGTLIENESPKDDNFIRGISSIKDLCLLSLEGAGMVGIPGFSKRLFDALAKKQINVILITQSSSEHSICVGVNVHDTHLAKIAVDAEFEQEINTQVVEPLIIEKDLSIIALVGEQMRNHPGVSGKMFGVLGRNGINVRAIAQGSSEKNITAVIASQDVRKAINVLHEEFFETSYKQVNVYVAGAGNVGGKLIEQIKKQVPYLQANLRLQINIVGIANSKKQLINVEGIDLSNWRDQLAAAPTGTITDYVAAIQENNLRNSIFVDVTAHATVADTYAQLLSKAVSVVACNKIACSSPYAHYAKLKSLARTYSAAFLFETNVGASLPIIGTLNDLIRSGDKINKIEAVLSGTLNFVFNNYDGSKSFAQVVKQAQDEGYTEPDPRLDLGGTDVMRKVMILAREAGHKLEMEDIANEAFLPVSCFNGSVEDFYAEMEKQEAHFKKIYEAAAAEGCKLKFVAKFETDENGKGHAKVGLQHIQPSSDFYHLYGKDNLVLFYSERYPELPLVIKGAGAGADVTASGVFADIIRAARV
ncbi:MAG: bifunctional aspartate kinase/homoserine dehydrogenase [Bacteroidota bacterium]|jgi:aspartokinase/homoserine dehydrogenase 1